MRSEGTRNDIAWESLFDEHRILSRVETDGRFRISAGQIKKYREPRLMTKFDHHSNLPVQFRRNDLSILPVTRGDYIIAPMDVYCKLDFTDDKPVTNLKLPDNLQSLDYNNITGESAAVNCAYVSGMLEHFLGETLVPTVGGRMSSELFSFKVRDMKNGSAMNIDVERSQVEIDGGFEGPDSLCLLEAKNSLSDDFLIRQLYYPYRLWSGKIEKRVRPVFMVYTNGIFHLFEYRFEDDTDMNSLVLIKKQRYSLEERGIRIDDIRGLIAKTASGPEPEVPFPQADSFERLVNLCELLRLRELTKDEITTTYDFDRRQTDYYANAGRYLGLIEDSEQDEPGCRLTPLGAEIFSLRIRERQLRLIDLIFGHSVFKGVMEQYLAKSEEPSRTDVVGIMKTSKLFNIGSEATYSRRASTVLGWLRWILNLTETGRQMKLF